MPKRIAISGVSGNIAQGIVKGLRRSTREYWLLGLDWSEDCAGFHMCDAGLTMPAVNAPDYADVLSCVLREHRVDLYLMGIDAEVAVVAPLRERLERESGTEIVVSDATLIDFCVDKLETARWLASMGMPYPRSFSGSVGVDQILRESSFPLIVKPRQGHGSVGLYKVDDAETLSALIEEGGHTLCVQEYIAGEEYTAALLFDRGGRMVDTICFARSLWRGTTMDAKVVRVPTVDAFLRTLGEKLPATGPINVQFRLDSEGQPLVFEINPRFSGTTALRVACGWNDPARIADHWLFGEPLVPLTVDPVRIFRYFEEMVVPLS